MVLSAPGCCLWTSTAEGAHYSGITPAGIGNAAAGNRKVEGKAEGRAGNPITDGAFFFLFSSWPALGHSDRGAGPPNQHQPRKTIDGALPCNAVKRLQSIYLKSPLLLPG